MSAAETNLEARAETTPKSTDLQCRRCKAWVGPDERVDDGEKLNPPVLCNDCDKLRTAQTWARMIKEQGVLSRLGRKINIYAFYPGQYWPLHGAYLNGREWEPDRWLDGGGYNRTGLQSGLDLMVDFEFDDEVKHV